MVVRGAPCSPDGATFWSPMQNKLQSYMLDQLSVFKSKLQRAESDNQQLRAALAAGNAKQLRISSREQVGRVRRLLWAQAVCFLLGHSTHHHYRMLWIAAPQDLTDAEDQSPVSMAAGLAYA